MKRGPHFTVLYNHEDKIPKSKGKIKFNIMNSIILHHFKGSTAILPNI